MPREEIVQSFPFPLYMFQINPEELLQIFLQTYYKLCRSWLEKLTDPSLGDHLTFQERKKRGRGGREKTNSREFHHVLPE